MNISQESLDLLKAAQAKPDDIIKSFVQPSTATTGLQAYNLEAPSKKLYPILTPLRNTIPRVGGSYAIQANWKTITNINVANVRAGVSEGKRGGVINYTLNEVFAAFRGFGMENSVTFEANYASKNFEDVKALAVQQTLEATMVQEERLILGGNTSVSLGTTPTPTLTSGTAGTLADGTYSVICVALGLQAYLDTVGVNNGSIGQYFNAATAEVPGAITRTNADGSTDTFGGGSARKSTNATIVIAADDDGSVTASVAPVTGAVGYAWFFGAAASEKLVAVTSINSVVITAEADADAQAASTLPAADSSTSTLDFDGLLYQAFKPGSNAYIKVMPTGTAGTGTALTADGAGGIVEFEEAFVNFYNRYRLSPDDVCQLARTGEHYQENHRQRRRTAAASDDGRRQSRFHPSWCGGGSVSKQGDRHASRDPRASKPARRHDLLLHQQPAVSDEQRLQRSSDADASGLLPA
jgi:hypothetical protein